jgi:hypothetical protein
VSTRRGAGKSGKRQATHFSEAEAVVRSRPMSLPRTLENLLCATVLLAAGLGCQAKIGDDCATGTDCSLTGGRTCDTSMPAGYCTIPNCEPDRCPEEASCIAFALAPATSAECRGIGESRGLRTFCLRRCSSSEDCRSGYECLDLNQTNNPWGAQRIDRDSSDGRVCTLRYGAIPAEPSDAQSTNYCNATGRSNQNDGYYNVAGSASWSDGSAGSAGSNGGQVGDSGGAAASAGSAGSAGSNGGQVGDSGGAAASAGSGG